MDPQNVNKKQYSKARVTYWERLLLEYSCLLQFNHALGIKQELLSFVLPLLIQHLHHHLELFLANTMVSLFLIYLHASAKTLFFA